MITHYKSIFYLYNFMKKFILAVITVSFALTVTAQNTFNNDGINVGIGTANPVEKLHIENGRLFLNSGVIVGGSVRYNYFYWMGHNLVMGTRPGAYSHNVVQLRPGGSDQGSLNSTLQMFTAPRQDSNVLKIQFQAEGISFLNGGNVGINTSVPSARLDVNGATQISGGANLTLKASETSATDPGDLVFAANNGTEYGRIYAQTGGTDLRFSVGATPAARMAITNGGNVGIGTTAPSQRLEIYTNGPSSMQLTNSADVLGSVGAVRFNMAGTEVSTIEAERTIATGRQTALKFSVKDDAGLKEAMRIADNGSIGIGTTSPGSYKLAVEGTIGARRVRITQEPTWADFVFHPDYKLPSLTEVENYIKTNQHLPEIPSAAEVAKDGFDLGEMNKKLLQKVEELTLYLIDMKKELNELKQCNETLEKKVQVNTRY